MSGGVAGIERQPVTEVADGAGVVLLLEIGAGTAEIVQGARPSLAGLGIDHRGAAADLLLERGTIVSLAPGEVLRALRPRQAGREQKQQP